MEVGGLMQLRPCGGAALRRWKSLRKYLKLFQSPRYVRSWSVTVQHALLLHGQHCHHLAEGGAASQVRMFGS